MLNKIILTIFAVAIVWLGFKYWNRLVLKPHRDRQRMPREGRSEQAAKAEAVEDMVECRSCGAFVPARRPQRCGRPDCPF